MGLGVEIEVEVLPRAEDAIQVGEPNGDGQEPRQFAKVNVVAKSGGELRIAGLSNQPTERDHTLDVLIG